MSAATTQQKSKHNILAFHYSFNIKLIQTAYIQLNYLLTISISEQHYAFKTKYMAHANNDCNHYM